MMLRRLRVRVAKTSLFLGAFVLIVSSSVMLDSGIAFADSTTPPGAPTNVTAAVSSTGITLHWTAPTIVGTNGSGSTATIVGYNVYAVTTSGSETIPGPPSCTWTTTSTGATNSCELTGLVAGTTYYYKVTSLNSGTPPNNESAPTSEASVSFVPPPVVTLSTTPTSPTYLGGAVTFTATLNLPAAGTVDFRVNASNVSCATQPVSTGPYIATCSTYTPTSAVSFTVDATFTPTNSNIYASSVASQITVPVGEATQAPLTITSTSGTDNSPLTLTTSGGSGSGSLSFAAINGTAANCVATGSVLTSTSAGTCLVTATQGSDGNYLPTSSPQTTVSFAQIVGSPPPGPAGGATQTPLAITSLSGTYHSPLTLTTSGGSGTGTVSFVAINGTATNCQVSGSTLTATSAGTCIMTAAKSADANFASTSSPQVAVTFAPVAQLPLSITSKSGAFGTRTVLTTRGGIGNGKITFNVLGGTAHNCKVSGSTLSATSTGTCIIKATKAADRNHQSVSSSKVSFIVERARPHALYVTSTSGTFGSTITLATSGGSGKGVVSFVVLGGTAAHCHLSGSSLSTAGAGTCLIKATKSSDDDYLSNSSALTAVRINRAAQASLFLTTRHGIFGVVTPLQSGGGTGTGMITYVASDLTASGCVIDTTGARVALAAASAGTCLVRVLKEGDRNHLNELSRLTPVVIARAPQAAFVLTVTKQSGGAALVLTLRGGSGAGRAVITVADGTATRCALSGVDLVSATTGTCLVSTTKQGDRDYLSTHVTDVVSFDGINQTPLTLTSSSVAVGKAISLSVSGGSGTGVVAYAVAGGTSKSCVVTGSTLVSQDAGTCQVFAVKKAEGSYRAVTSGLVTFTFTNKVVARVVARVVAVSPTTGLLAGAVVRISGSGYVPKQPVLIVECVVGATRLTQCDRASTRTVVVDKSGDLPATFLRVSTGEIGPRTCGTTASNLSGCELHISSGTFSEAKVVLLTFVRVVPELHFSVAPSTNLKNGEVVILSGTGFTPNDRVYYAECLVGAITKSLCKLTTFKLAIITSTGVFPSTKLTIVTGAIGPGTCGTSASDLRACEIDVANSSLGDAAKAHITFAQP